MVPDHGTRKTYVYVLGKGRESFRGLLQAVSTDVARLRFQGSPSPCFALGSRVDLLFPLDTSAPTFPGVVAHRCERSDERDYDISLVVPLSRRAQLCDVISRVCNLRTGFRVRPGKERCTLRIRSCRTAAWTPCDLKDVSIGGVGLTLRTTVEPEDFAHARWLEIELCLPPEGTPLYLMGTIVNRRLLGLCARYGVKFDCSRTNDFGAIEARILAYVMARQQDALAARARTPVFGPG
jgi:hypothetical protein